ncbi:hypothetical protein [Streptomyces sp. SCA2-2]|uniref:hypothetical protein n=1 Tax=Streptomyces sp. SCA2-2 TaxID=1563677 RepID=UPI0010211586|nr:hypothetical protein [Streptomyces sp. SCA2-2]RZE99443.1 hypothetical protein C0L86_11505 [Streptomyces sp. SCA2-2]
MTTPGVWRLHTRTTLPGTSPTSPSTARTSPGRPPDSTRCPHGDHRPLSTRLAHLSEAERWEEFDACGAELNRTLALHAPDGLPVADFLLHVEPGEARARFRWSDEPVEDPAREDPVSPAP